MAGRVWRSGWRWLSRVPNAVGTGREASGVEGFRGRGGRRRWLASAIVDDALAPRTMQRLLAEDLYSGWGVRTLSCDHPAFNPYSYHRGSVWPVEHGTFAFAFQRYGCHEGVERIARGMFEATA